MKTAPGAPVQTITSSKSKHQSGAIARQKQRTEPAPSSTAYRMSFSTGGLCVSESLALAQLYIAEKSWERAKEAATTQKVLGFRTQSSSKRTVRELVMRLQQLSEGELDLFIETDRKQQALLLWLAVCRTYSFLGQFAVEVLQEHFLSLRMVLSYADFDQFYDAKAEWSDALAKISKSTRAKLRQVAFRMMREAEILTGDGRLMPVYLPDTLKACVAAKDGRDLRYFPGVRWDGGAG